jgi:3-deoxy-D-arabino-heptulosonate 7-phosphate (DAHP) synthase
MMYVSNKIEFELQFVDSCDDLMLHSIHPTHKAGGCSVSDPCTGWDATCAVALYVKYNLVDRS